MAQLSQFGMGETYNRGKLYPGSRSPPHGPWVAWDFRTLKTLESSQGKDHGVASKVKEAGCEVRLKLPWMKTSRLWKHLKLSWEKLHLFKKRLVLCPFHTKWEKPLYGVFLLSPSVFHLREKELNIRVRTILEVSDLHFISSPYGVQNFLLLKLYIFMLFNPLRLSGLNTGTNS